MGVIGSLAAAALGLLLLFDVVIRGSWAQALLIAPWVLAGVGLIYVITALSSVTTDAEGVTVQNLFRRTRMPWGEVADVALRWQLVFTLVDDRIVRAFGGPAAGRRGSARAERDAELVRDVWKRATAAGAAGGPVRTSWDAAAISVAVGILVWALIAIVSAGSAAQPTFESLTGASR